MAACSRCTTQLQPNAQVCLGCGLALGGSAAIPMTAPVAPAMPSVAAPVVPPVENPWRTSEPLGHRPATPRVEAASRYGVPQPVERPAAPIMPPNPFAKGAQTDRGPLPPQMPVRHESASIPVAFAQFSLEPEPAEGESAAPAEHAEVVILRPTLAEALEAALAELPEDAPERAPEPFPEVLSVAPPAKAAPGWS